MKWTKKKPTKTGWYLIIWVGGWNGDPSLEDACWVEIVRPRKHLYVSHGTARNFGEPKLLSKYDSKYYQWLGPISLPKPLEEK
jgi:hypothetical protein